MHAIGLILSELVSGRAAYEGEEQSEFAVACLTGARPTPRVLGAEVSDDFEALCGKALAMMSKDRFQDAGELLVAMGALGWGGRETNRVAGATVAESPHMSALGGGSIPGAGNTQLAGAMDLREAMLRSGIATQPSIPRGPAVRSAGKIPGWAVAGIGGALVLSGVVATIGALKAKALFESVAPIASDLPEPPNQELAAVPIFKNDPSWGNPNAPVTIVLFSDYQCPFCSRLEDTLAQVRTTYGKDKVRIV